MASLALSFFGFNKKKRFSNLSLDQKLVYALSPRKIPNSAQLKHLKKFLNPKENLIIKICLLIILINAVYLSVNFFNKHLQYVPVHGGEYIEGVVAYPKTINPLYAVNRDVDSDLSKLVYSSLFKYDQNGALVNDLAESYEIVNPKEYLVKIRSNAKWHDGDRVTIDDVIFTIEAIKNQEYRSPLKSSFSGIEIEKLDDLTIKFILNTPYAPFLEVLNFGILPKHIWVNISPSSAVLSELNLKPIGSGPYSFKSLLKSKEGDLKEYNLVVNDDYYLSKPYIKSIKFKFFINYTEAIKALNDNQIDGLGYLPFESRKDVLAKDSLSFNELVRPQIISLFFNQEKDKALANKIVRVSLAQSIDKNSLIDEVFSGVYKRADGPILENNFAYNNQIKKYDYLPDEARENIKNKLASTTITVIDSSSNVQVAEKIKAYWEKIGVEVSLNIVPGERAAEIIRNRAFEVLLYGESVGGDPDVYAFWHSLQSGAKGLNLAAYNNPEVDKLLVEARETNEINQRIEKYKKFQEIVSNDIPAIFLYSPTYTYIQSKKVKGFNGLVIIEPADRFSSIANWYLKTSKKIAW